MLYLATPSGPDVRAAMSAGEFGCMTTPAQGNRVPEGAVYACDNGRFGKGWPGHAEWFAWLRQTVRRYGAASCLWATAPDVPMQAAATLGESRPWLPQIRSLGIRAAFVAQDGCEDDLIPWGEFDVLFLGGSTEWKIGPKARLVAGEATRRDVAVHMGRVNSKKRLVLAKRFGCTTADGTYLTFGPKVNLPRLTRWMKELDAT